MVNKINNSNIGKVKLNTIGKLNITGKLKTTETLKLSSKQLTEKPVVFARFTRDFSETDTLKFAQDFKAWEVGNSVTTDNPTTTDANAPKNKVLSFTYDPFRKIQISSRGGDFFIESTKEQTNPDGTPKFGESGEFVIFDPRGNDKYKMLFPKREFDPNEPVAYRILFPERPFMIKTTSWYKNEKDIEITEKRNDFGIMYLGNNNFKLIATSPDLVSLRMTQPKLLMSQTEMISIKDENAATFQKMLEDFHQRKEFLANDTGYIYAKVDIRGKIKGFVNFERKDVFRLEKRSLAGKTGEVLFLAKYLVQQMSGKSLAVSKSFEQIKLEPEGFVFADGLEEQPLKMIRSILELTATKVSANLANKGLK